MNLYTEAMILRVNHNEISRLQDIGKRTFSETFSEDNSAENMQTYLEDRFSEEELRSQLNEELSQFYFAVLADRVIGYLKINFGSAQTEIKN